MENTKINTFIRSTIDVIQKDQIIEMYTTAAVVVLCHRVSAFFLLFLVSLVSAQSGGGYVVRGVPRIINGNTIVVGGTEVTL